MKPAHTTRQYLVDNKGHRRAVVVDVEEYDKMLEDIEDLRIIAERKTNPKLSAVQFVARLKKHAVL